MIALVCLLALAQAAPEAAPPASEARLYIASAAALYASLENDKALEQLAVAKRLARRADESVLISLYEGLIHTDEGRRSEAEAAFRTAFSLNPDAELPVKVSPHLRQWIDSLREQARKALTRAEPKYAPVPAPEPAPAAVPLPRPPAPTWRSRAWIPAVVGAVLLAGAGAGAGLEQGVEGRLRRGDGAIQSPAQLDQLYGQGRAYTFAAEGLAVAGGASLAAAAALLLWGGGEREWVVAPRVGGATVGLRF